MNLAKTLLAAALGGALASPAAADIRLSSSGLGEAVYVPFYSVDDGLDSLISVGNDSDQPTMVRLLLAEALNGQTVMYFNIYLPAHSVWSGSVSSRENGRAVINSSSTVCSLPILTPEGFVLVPFDYANNFPDGGPTDFSRTRSGAVEILELAALTGELADATNALDCDAIQDAYTTVNGVQPDRTDMLLPPSGAVSAKVQLISVADGLVFSVPDFAVSGFSATARDPGFEVAPRFANPVLSEGQTEFIAETAVGTLHFSADRGPDAISSLFMQARLSGEFYANQELGASTRWAVSFPTKAAYVSERPGSLATGGVAVPPFSDFFDADGSCDTVATRDGFLDGTPLVTVAPTSIELCAQINVVDFSDAFAEAGKRDLQFVEPEGRTIFAQSPAGTPLALSGLPAVGVQMSNFVNGQLQGGVLANYSISQPLRGKPSELAIPIDTAR